MNTIKILFRFSKSSEHDKLFTNEEVLKLVLPILDIHITDEHILMTLTSKMIKGKQAGNDENLADLVIYTAGMMKNATLN